MIFTIFILDNKTKMISDKEVENLSDADWKPTQRSCIFHCDSDNLLSLSTLKTIFLEGLNSFIINDRNNGIIFVSIHLVLWQNFFRKIAL